MIIFAQTDSAHGLPTETEGVVDTLAQIVLGDPDVVDRLRLLAEEKAKKARIDGANGSKEPARKGS